VHSIHLVIVFALVVLVFAAFLREWMSPLRVCAERVAGKDRRDRRPCPGLSAWVNASVSTPIAYQTNTSE